MNGLKLGGQKSFAFENEFMNIDGSNYAESINQYSQSASFSEKQPQYPQSHKYKNNAQKRNGQLLIQSKIKNSLKSDQKQPTQQKQNEVKRIKNLNNGMSSLSNSILQMRQKYKQLDFEQIMLKKHNKQREKQIKLFLTKKQQQKKRLKEKIQSARIKEKKILEESIILEDEKKKKITKNRVDDGIKKIAQMKQKWEINKLKQAQKDKKVDLMYSKINQEEKVQKKFHLRKLQEDVRKKMKKIEEDKQILAKRKQKYEPIDYESFELHEYRHSQLVKQLQAVKRAQREQEYRQIVEKNHQFDNVYRGHSYDFAQEEYQERKQKRKQQQPKIKQQKIKQYEEYVRQNFIPKTHQYNHQSVELSPVHSQRQVKRYRYYKGVSYGEVVENRAVAKSQQQIKKIGNDNMAFMRSLPKRKKIQNHQNLSTQDIQKLDHKLNSIVKVKQQRNPLYDRNQRHSHEVKISSKPTRQQLNMVIEQLKVKDKQFKRKQLLIRNQINSFQGLAQKNRQINRNIVGNIEKKLNLLSKM